MSAIGFELRVMICRRVPWPRRVRLGVEVGSPVRAVAVRHFTLELDDLPASLISLSLVEPTVIGGLKVDRGCWSDLGLFQASVPLSCLSSARRSSIVSA